MSVQSTVATPDTCAIIVAGGRGERFGDIRGKQFVPLQGLPMAAWSLKAFAEAPSVGTLVVVCSPERFDEMREEVVEPLNLSVPVHFAPSGNVRQASCFSGLQALSRLQKQSLEHAYPFVAIHDAARPLITTAGIERVIECVRSNTTLDGAICARPAVDTLKVVQTSQGASETTKLPLIVSTPDRSKCWYAETPQVFRFEAIYSAHEQAAHDGFTGTDDASLVERLGGHVAVVDPACENLKVTLPGDKTIAEAILSARQQATTSCSA